MPIGWQTGVVVLLFLPTLLDIALLLECRTRNPKAGESYSLVPTSA